MAETSRASLGFVTSYGAAKRGGYEGTYEEWCALMAEVADHLEQNESLYADTTTAKEAAEAAQGYAEVAQGKAEDAQTAAETAQGKAEDAEDAAEAWAAGTSGGTPSATNNASYYAGQASDSATASAASAASAEAWATGGSSGTSSATNNAKYYSDQAEDSAEAAEAWATGGSGGTASASNNAKYYSEQAATSATAAAAVGSNFAPTFSSSTAYSAGDYVMYNGTQYRFTANHAAGAWTGSDAVAEPISPVVADLKTHKANYNTVGFNQWDEVWEIGGITADGTNNDSATTTIRSKNYIPVFDTLKYFFHAPVVMWVHCYDATYTHLGMLNNGSSFVDVAFPLISGTKYLRFATKAYGTTYNNDICVNISQSDTNVDPHNGQYVSYSGSDPVYNRVLKDEADELNYRNAITKFENVSKNISDFPGVEVKTGYSASATSTKINVTTLATMDTYIYFISNSVSLYFDSDVIASDGYLAVCKIENARRESATEIFGESGVRYRKSDNNLPTSLNPLSLPAGSAIAITIPTGTDVAVVTNGIFRTLSDYVLLNNDQKAENTFHIAFNGSMFSIDMGVSKLYVEHQTNETIRQDVWRVSRGTIISNGAEYDMWNGSDADGVVILDGESDFLGGFHGDEVTTKITCFIDGIEHPISTAFNKKEFTNFSLYVESDVYHCIDSAESSTKAFERNKIININKDGCAITNYWKAISSVDVKTAYMGMLSVAKTLVTDYSMNSDSAVRDNETAYPGASYCDKAKMQLSTGNVIEYSMSDRSKQSPWGYGIIYTGTGVSNRVKTYFAEIYEDTYMTLAVGDIIRATSNMKIC